MSIPKTPDKAQLFVGILYSDKSKFHAAVKSMTEIFGSLDFFTCPRLFNETNYYEKEMGRPIFRVYATFENLVDQDKIVDIKISTNQLEKTLSENGKRTVNIDPGLLSEERLILATGKNYTHRIYLRCGIYADLTLIYYRGQYNPLPWTYPDYKDPKLLHFLGVMRQKLIFKRNKKLPSKPYRLPVSEKE